MIDLPMAYCIVCLVPQCSSITSPAFRWGCEQVFIMVIVTFDSSLLPIKRCPLVPLSYSFSGYFRHLFLLVYYREHLILVDCCLSCCGCGCGCRRSIGRFAIVVTEIFFANRNKIEFVKLVSSNLKYRSKYRFKRMRICASLGLDREVPCQLNMSH